MIKSYLSALENTQQTLTDEDLKCIHRYTRRPMTADELYTFSMVLCDNEIDRDLERFGIDALETIAGMFVGTTGLFDHSLQSRDQTARIYKTECRTDPTRRTETGEPYTYVFAAAYMPLTPENASLRTEIDAGIKKEVSVHCSSAVRRCSVCGADVLHAPCAHRKGDVVDGKVCHHILSAPTDAYEWSFVAVPAQRAAGVVKSFRNKEEPMQDILSTVRKSTDSLTLSPQQLTALQAQLCELESEASLGKAYHVQLIQDTMRLALAAMPDADGDALKSVCEKLTADELQALRKGFTTLANHRIPLQPQLRLPDSPSEEDSAFII
ncbi:MAG: hypothetical protein IJT44_02685 [Clostridia bacterium]|nr:hypothetical protein [Clostridia bacterium]